MPILEIQLPEGSRILRRAKSASNPSSVTLFAYVPPGHVARTRALWVKSYEGETLKDTANRPRDGKGFLFTGRTRLTQG